MRAAIVIPDEAQAIARRFVAPDFQVRASPIGPGQLRVLARTRLDLAVPAHRERMVALLRAFQEAPRRRH